MSESAAQVSDAIELLITAQQSGEDAAVEKDCILEILLPPDKSGKRINWQKFELKLEDALPKIVDSASSYIIYEQCK